MNEVKTVEKPTNPIWDVDEAELGIFLEKLLTDYRIALKFVDAWNLIESTPIEGRDKYILKPITRWFLEAHVHSRLISISQKLRIEQLRTVNQIEGALHQKLSGYLEILEETSKALFKWENLLVFLTSSFPIILTLLSPLIAGGVIDFTSSVEAFKWLDSVIRDPDIRTGILVLLLITMFSLLLAAIFAVAQASFLAKREIFLQLKLYKSEADVYRSLRAKRPMEFPVDAFIKPEISLVIGFLLLLMFGLAKSGASNFEDILQLYKPWFTIYLGFLVIIVIRALIVFRSRKIYGNA